MIAAIVTKAGSTIVTGLVGAAAYDGVKRAARTGVLREGAVTTIAWGIRGRRSAETGAERVRLATGDLVAEARGRVGEQASPPAAAATHDHEH